MPRITEELIRELVRELMIEADVPVPIKPQQRNIKTNIVDPANTKPINTNVAKVDPKTLPDPIKNKIDTRIPATNNKVDITTNPVILQRYQKQIKLIKDGFRESELQSSLQLLIKSLRDFNRNITQTTNNVVDVNFKSSLVLTASQDLTNKLNFISKEFFKLIKMTNDKA